jgi:2-polyprenyl-3-methyl-5-hydroxy-6-metoxy-1,4-benzoquinol methylase
MGNMIDTTRIKIYQPIPFKEYEGLSSSRKDCIERYLAIKKHIPEIKGKTLIDLCCSNGFFPVSFLIDGGKSAVGVENNHEEVMFNNLLAKEQGLDFRCYESIDEVKGSFDYAIYLDTHYHTRTEGYLEFIHKSAPLAFISCAGDGEMNNERIYGDLKKLYSSVEEIYKGFAQRKIYKCQI